MVTVDQVKRGAARYIDTEIMPKLSGWRRWVVGAGATAYIAKADELLDRARRVPAIAVLGAIDDDHLVDIEMVYQAVRPQAEREPAAFDIPGVGKLTMTAADVDKLYNYIISA